jgi:hypothetical protein
MRMGTADDDIFSVMEVNISILLWREIRESAGVKERGMCVEKRQEPGRSCQLLQKQVGPTIEKEEGRRQTGSRISS